MSLHSSYCPGSFSPLSSSSSLSSFGTSSSLSKCLSSLIISLPMTMMILIIAFQSMNLPSSTMAIEFHRPYDHRSAMNTLKELDKYYSQMARPRFGKRDSSFIPNVDNNNNNLVEALMAAGNGNVGSGSGSSSDTIEFIGEAPNPMFNDIPNKNRWLLINREQPMTKLTQNYLLEILLDNMENGREQPPQPQQSNQQQQLESKLRPAAQQKRQMINRSSI